MIFGGDVCEHASAEHLTPTDVTTLPSSIASDVAEIAAAGQRENTISVGGDRISGGVHQYVNSREEKTKRERPLA
jgi:hypothetical protein